MADFDFLLAESTLHFKAASELIKEYASGLNFDLGFQHFDEELNNLSVHYNRNDGGMILIHRAGDFMGCAGIRKFEPGIAELKRMYIQPTHRGLGLGTSLMTKAIDLATERGYTKVRLDTIRTMENAVNIYLKFGFYEIAPYRFNPNDDVLYLEKILN